MTNRFHRHVRPLAAIAIAATAVALLPTAAVAASSPARTKISISSAKPSAGSVVINGGKLVLKGTTSANLARHRLYVQVKRGSKWRPTPASAVVSKHHTFSTTVLVATGRPGVFAYRLVFIKTRTLAASAASRAVRVWNWYSLANQQVVKSAGGCCGDSSDVGTVSVAGHSYSNAISMSTDYDIPTWNEYNLGYHCISFRTLAGLDDSNDDGATATAIVSADGAQRAAQALSLGRAVKMTVNVKGVFRLHLQESAANGVTTDFPAAAILCNANPNPNQ